MRPIDNQHVIEIKPLPSPRIVKSKLPITDQQMIKMWPCNHLGFAYGNYLPHLLPVDPTLHWANPPGGEARKDMAGTDNTPYTGPVPIITHVHGAHVDAGFKSGR